MGEKVNFRVRPDLASRVLGRLSFRDSNLYVLDSGPLQTIAPFGRHRWIKIRKGKRVGWVFDAFVAPTVPVPPDPDDVEDEP